MRSGMGVIGHPALIEVVFENGFRLFRIGLAGSTKVVREGLLGGLVVIRMAGMNRSGVFGDRSIIRD